MSSGPHNNNGNGNGTIQAPASGMSLDDVIYTFFRHKWLILSFFCVGIVAALLLQILKPPGYTSYARIMVHYVEETGPTLVKDDTRIFSTQSGQTILNEEKEILRSRDVVTNAANIVGPERVLAKVGGGSDLLAAAGVIGRGIEVEVIPQTTILTISFKNRDPDLVQPVLSAVLEAYMEQHNQVRGMKHELDTFYKRQRDELRRELDRIQGELTQVMTSNKLVLIDQTMPNLATQIDKWKDELRSAQVELATKRAVLGDSANATNENSTGFVSADKIEEYGDLNSQLTHLKHNLDELRLHYKEAYPTVLTVKTQIGKLNEQKLAMEKDFPALALLASSRGRDGTNSPANDLTEIRKLTARVSYVSNIVETLETEAAHIQSVAPIINDLESRRNSVATNLAHLTKSFETDRINQWVNADKSVNMSTIEKPTPPGVDHKKQMKRLVGVFMGCVAFGFGLAFLIDFFLDPTIRRSADVQRQLHLPVFLAIPDTNWNRGLKLAVGSKQNAVAVTNGQDTSMAIGQHRPEQKLDVYTDGLRERLLTYFEVHHPEHKKTKMVAVTGCDEGAGVSVLASGLARSLSKSVDCKVLLVKLNGENGVAREFSGGKAGASMPKALELTEDSGVEKSEDYQKEEDRSSNNQEMGIVPSSGFAQMVPNLQTSEYDFVIFDMPPVTPLSSTPRLASHMDLVLMVLESERTGKQSAARAATLMHEARVNVKTILNKYRAYVPERLSQES